MSNKEQFHFPKWTNQLPALLGILALGGVIYVVVLLTTVFSPEMSAVGYTPEQPVAYSHALHAGDLNIDCRYCHIDAESTAKANIPPTSTCMNCHDTIKFESEALALVRQSAVDGTPIRWNRVHDLPDFVYFNHAGHVQSGVGCVTCHGRVDRMEKVSQVSRMTMSWCLDCHRDPDDSIRPKELVTNMTWVADGNPAELGAELRKENNINPSTDCSTCHR